MTTTGTSETTPSRLDHRGWWLLPLLVVILQAVLVVIWVTSDLNYCPVGDDEGECTRRGDMTGRAWVIAPWLVAVAALAVVGLRRRWPRAAVWAVACTVLTCGVALVHATWLLELYY